MDKQLKTLHDYCSKMGMTFNTDNTKIMIIRSKKITHGNFVYDNNCLDQVSSYKYLGIDIPYNSIRITTLRKGLLEAGKIIMSLKAIARLPNFVFGVKKGSSLRPSSPLWSIRL